MAGQQSGTGGFTNLDDEKVRKDDILSNRDKATRGPGRSLDGTGVQDASDEDDDTQEQVDRPGFDQGGATGDNTAGKGLGLGRNAKEDRKDWKLPR